MIRFAVKLVDGYLRQHVALARGAVRDAPFEISRCCRLWTSEREGDGVGALERSSVVNEMVFVWAEVEANSAEEAIRRVSEVFPSGPLWVQLAPDGELIAPYRPS